MGEGTESAVIADFGDSIMGIEQHFAGILQPKPNQVFLKGHAEIRVELSAQVILCQPRLTRHIGKSERLPELGFQNLNGFHQRGLVGFLGKAPAGCSKQLDKQRIQQMPAVRGAETVRTILRCGKQPA